MLTDGPMTESFGILIAHLGAFASGELKNTVFLFSCHGQQEFCINYCPWINPVKFGEIHHVA